jgi:RNA polymerase sigma-70 factor (ECF subfamily)
VSSDFTPHLFYPIQESSLRFVAYTNTQEDFEDYYQEVCLQFEKPTVFENNRVVHLGLQDIIKCMLDFTKEKKKHHFVSDSLPDEAIGQSFFVDESLTNSIRQSDNYLK